MRDLFILLVVGIICVSLSTPALAQREVAPPAVVPITENPVQTEPPVVVEPPPAPSPVQAKPQVQPPEVQSSKATAVRIRKAQNPKNQPVQAKGKPRTPKQKVRDAKGQSKVNKARTSSPKKLRQTTIIRRR